VFQDESFAELKIRFFDLMAGYFREQKDAFSLCDCYHQMYNTTSVKENDEECRNMLERTVTFAVLSPYSNEQQDLLHRLNAIDTELADAEHLKEVLKLFTTNELIAYPFAQQQRLLGIDAVTAWGEDLAAHWGVIMHTRVVEHNVRVAAKYYSRIAGKRLSALLGLSYDDLEAHISNMVSSGDIYAKIDRPRDVIVFKRALGQDEILNDWKGDINELLNLVEDTTHEINKEMMAV
jgi:26S proteasome regulatory subunit N5